MFTQRPSAPPVTLTAFPKMLPVRNGTSPSPHAQTPIIEATRMDTASRFTSTTILGADSIASVAPAKQ